MTPGAENGKLLHLKKKKKLYRTTSFSFNDVSSFFLISSFLHISELLFGSLAFKKIVYSILGVITLEVKINIKMAFSELY